MSIGLHSPPTGVMLYLSGKAFCFSFDRKEVTTYVSLKISGEKKIRYCLLIGLEEESPDAGSGIVLTHTF